VARLARSVRRDRAFARERERLRWQVGGYYLDMEWNTFQSLQGALILGGTSDTQIMSTFGTIDSKNGSAFGQVEFDLSPQWTLITGLRWSQDDKHLEMRRIYADVPEGIAPTETFDIDDVTIPGVDDIDYGDYAARAMPALMAGSWSWWSRQRRA
jgi:iron complex outermembrane recepter protein